MCIICQSFQPWTEDCIYAPAGEGAVPGNETAAPAIVFTYDQIAVQLTDGFWVPYGGSRSFDVSSGETLFVDTSALTATGQTLAHQALEAWSVVTGLTFIEVDSTAPPVNVFAEGADAAEGSSTAYSMSVGDDFTGTLATGADRDAVAVSLVAGQTVTIELSGNSDGGNATSDPFLWLLDGTGVIVAQNDDAIGTNSAVTYQATASGTYFVRAGSFADSHPGDYRISIREASLSVDIVFDDEQAGAFASSSVSEGVIQSAFVNINSTWAGGSGRTDGYHFQTYIHEIGHALGLGHAGNYNGSASYGSDALYLNDSWQASVMSYFHQSENSWLDADFAYAITPMMADIIAIQSLYGAATSNQGDTIYGNGGNTGTYLDSALSLSNPVAYTVFDTDGVDTFDFSSYSAHQRLDLREETYSDLAGLDGNIGIARGAIIENGMTGGGNDTLTGNEAGNLLSAGAGSDMVNGGAGNDAIRGGSGNDILSGSHGLDLVEGGTGNDWIDGGAGGDLLLGGDMTLDLLATLFPQWSPPPDVEVLFDTGNLVAIWEDILSDLAIA